MKKRILSILLAICMVVGLLPGMALGTAAAETADEMTIYFQNNWLWTDVCIYFWKDTTPVSAAWPGNAMEQIGNDGTYDIYKATVPTDVTGIVISGIKNDGSGSRDQTPDITDGWYDGICYYMKWDNGNQVGSENIAVIYPDAVPAYVAEVDGQDFETLADAIAAAQTIEGSTVKLLTNVSLDTYITIDSGKFTIDMNGKTWESSVWALYVQGTAEVTLTSTADGGILRGTGSGYQTIALYDTAQLEISGGTVEHTGNSLVIDMSDGGNLTNAQLIISGGKVATNGNMAIQAFGSSVTITGGTVESTYANMQYASGIVDLSGHPDPAGIKIEIGYTITEALVGTDILLPEGYCFVDEDGNPVTTLTTYNTYTVAEVVYGDVTGDGEISLADILRLRRYLAACDPITGESAVEVAEGADVNGDGEITLADVLLLRQYLSSRDPETGESPVELGPQ